jgi:hypothetical protein
MAVLQWLEPLMVASWGQPDCYAVQDDWQSAEGSWRMMANNHSSMGTRNVSLQPRNARRQLTSASFESRQLPPYSGNVDPWTARDALPFLQRRGMQFSLPPFYHSAGETMAAYLETAIRGTDFRRAQKEPFGFEFRIFDHFPTEYLSDVLHILVLICDHSAHLYRQKVTVEQLPDARENADWNQLVREVFLEGWNARIPMTQLVTLDQALQLDLRSAPMTAFDTMRAIVDRLWELYGGGKGEYSRHLIAKSQQSRKPSLENLNRTSFDAAAQLWLDRNPKLESHVELEEVNDI